MSNYNECIKRKYKKPIFTKCKELGLNVKDSMSIEELCKTYHDYFHKHKESLSKQSPKKIQIIPMNIIDRNYKKYKTNELLTMCRKRGLTLRSVTRSYLIERLEKDDKKSSQKSIPKEKSSQKSIPKEKSSQKKQYINYSVKDLISLCRERKIPLKSYKKDFMIQKLQKSSEKSIPKEKSSEKSIPKEKSSEKSIPKEKSSEKSIPKEKLNVNHLLEEKKFNDIAEYIRKCYI